jgi:cholest-4-en-3-one 26-monooxygenase
MATQVEDVLDPDLYVRGVPHERFARLRREAPVSWHAEPGGPGFWSVTKHRDVQNVLKEAATFSSALGGTQIPDLPIHDLRRSPDVLAVMDPPKHTRYRALIGQSFTKRGLARTEAHVRDLVDRLLGELVQRGSFDFAGDFAAKLPMATILHLVGVPADAQEQINDWVMRLLATDDPEYATSEQERTVIGGRFMEYAHMLAAQRRREPRDDLLSLLMAAEVDGMKLRYEEFGMFFMLLLAAGTDTPRLALGSGMVALMEHSELRKLLARRPELISGAVEEVLRCYPPLMHFRRTATRDTEIRGQRIRAGEKVVVWLVSANRDEDVFPNAGVFDPQRKQNDHLAFGHGPHFCIGNALARMTVGIALNECLRRLDGIELDGTPERVRSNWFNGMKRIPVRVGGRG